MMVERKSMLVRETKTCYTSISLLRYKSKKITEIKNNIVFISVLAVKAKEHHRVEKSVPPRGHETSSSDQITNHHAKFPSFPSFPTLSGAFQVHHLPPISPGIIFVHEENI